MKIISYPLGFIPIFKVSSVEVDDDCIRIYVDGETSDDGYVEFEFLEEEDARSECNRLKGFFVNETNEQVFEFNKNLMENEDDDDEW